MKPILFAIPLFLAASLGSAYPDPLTKGLPPPPLNTTTKGLPPPPLNTTTKGLPPPPLNTTTKGLPPPPPNTILSLPGIDAAASNLSTPCASAIFSIVLSPEFLTCVPVTAVAAIIPLITNPKLVTDFLADPKKGYPPVQKQLIPFSQALCPAPKCSDNGTQAALKALTDGCQVEIKKKDPLIEFAIAVITFYSPLHDSICFKNKKGTFCWDETTTTIINLPKSPIKIIDGGTIDSIAVADPDQICTSCNRAIVNTFGNFLKQKPETIGALAAFNITTKDLSLAQVGIAVKCGINFENGTVN